MPIPRLIRVVTGCIVEFTVLVTVLLTKDRTGVIERTKTSLKVFVVSSLKVKAIGTVTVLRCCLSGKGGS